MPDSGRSNVVRKSPMRALARLVAVVSITALSYVHLLLILPFRRPAPAWHLRRRCAVFRRWGRALSKIMGMRTMVVGKPPTAPFFLVSNHLGYMDIILLGTHIDAAFVAKADLHGWPLLGRAFAAADTIFIDRSRRRDVIRVTRLIEDHLARPLGVLLFPEGTSGEGDRLLPFKASLLDLPARRGQPVHWVLLRYQTAADDPAARDTVAWWGDAPFVPHFWQLAQLPAFDATIHFGDEPVTDTDRKALARRLHAAMSEAFEPMG